MIASQLFNPTNTDIRAMMGKDTRRKGFAMGFTSGGSKNVSI